MIVKASRNQITKMELDDKERKAERAVKTLRREMNEGYDNYNKIKKSPAAYGGSGTKEEKTAKGLKKAEAYLQQATDSERALAQAEKQLYDLRQKRAAYELMRDMISEKIMKEFGLSSLAPTSFQKIGQSQSKEFRKEYVFEVDYSTSPPTVNFASQTTPAQAIEEPKLELPPVAFVRGGLDSQGASLPHQPVAPTASEPPATPAPTASQPAPEPIQELPPVENVIGPEERPFLDEYGILIGLIAAIIVAIAIAWRFLLK